MRIERIEIDGFGHFAGEQWELNEGMTVMLGENEAGKTTLLNAIRALLFGFESTRDGRAWYPALAGGKRGGRLLLRMQDGARWTVDRHGERGGAGALVVEAPNGNRGGQEQLIGLLGGADRDLFNNIFAFGLGELEAFSSLSAEGIRGRIYGAGSGLGGTSVLDIERQLRGEQDAAYRPRGHEQTLARLLGKMEELRSRIAELEQPAAYELAGRELAELRERHAALRAARSAAAERRERLRRLLEAQAPAARLSTLRQELGEADPRVDAMAPDAEATLDRLLTAQREADAELANLDQSIADAERRRAAVTCDEAVLAETAEIEALRDERVSHEARAADEREARAAASRIHGELQDQLRQVGGWSEERLLAIDDSIAAVEALREHERGLAAARMAADRLDERLDAARRDVAAAQDDLPSGDLDDHEIAARRAALSGLAEMRIQAAAADAGERVAAGASGTVPGWLVALGAAALLLMVGTLLGGYLDLQPAGTAAGAALGIVAAGWLLRRRGAVTPAADREALAARRADLLQRAGLPSDADAATIDAAADALAMARASLRSSEQQRIRLAERRSALDRLEAEASDARAARDATNGAWRAWLTEHGLSPDLSPEAARQVVAAVGAGRRMVRERDEQRERAAAIGAAAARFDARLDGLLQRLGRPIPAEASLRPSTVVALAREAQHSAAERVRASDLDATIAELRGRRQPRTAALEAASSDLRAHLQHTGAADAAELRRLAAAAAARVQTRHAMREATATLLGLAGSEEALPALIAEAGATDPATLQAEREEVVAEVARLEAEEAESLTREGELRGEIGRLETADELGAARQELALLQARADDESRRWAVRAVALALLGETRRRYERERQPQVVRDAERYFAAITDGRYPRIVAAPGEANVRVEPESGAARTTDQLSRGTAEQLYLALRFGLIEQFARVTEPLPVVMDDILVNFDRERATRAAHAIRDLATRHQVVFFTCHPQTAELLDPDGVATVRLG
ncbi:MAG TPA: AAA family ATPase [Candidatus Limnocylindria bacterium]|nr:AAA family ATPase [Candidatus Limnocylindria bacterium]